MQRQLLIGEQYVADKNLKLWLDSAVQASYPGTGSTWYDLSGNRNHGTLVGISSTTTVLDAKTFGFDGTSNRVSFSPYATPIQSNSTQFTWNCWVKANRNYDGDVIMGNRGGGELKFAKITTQKFEYYPAEVFNPVSTTAWVNLTVVWDGTGSSAGTNMKWYQNGISVGLRNGVNPSFSTGTMVFNIGGDNIAGEYYQGYLSMAQVWDRALTATEILNNFKNYAARFGLAPATPGQPWGGGFYAGKINVSGTQYYLIVAPKASGENSSRAWGPTGATGITSVINGPTNSASLAALGASYQAAVFCEGLTIGGYSDWYLPAKNELEVLYYFLKPTTDENNTASGSNANAVSPEPISTNYTSGSPAQTSAGIGFRTGETNALAGYYWSSTDFDSNFSWYVNSDNGFQNAGFKVGNNYVRAVRRVPV